MPILTDILSEYGVDVTWYQRQADGSYANQGAIRVMHFPDGTMESLLEPGYMSSDYRRLYTETALGHLDRLVIDNETWEVQGRPEKYSSVGETFYRVLVKRRLS